MSKILSTKVLPAEYNLDDIRNAVPHSVGLTLFHNETGVWLQSTSISDELYQDIYNKIGDILYTKPIQDEINWGKVISPVGLNCRAEASASSSVVEVLQEGQRFHILYDCGEWYQIDKPCNGYLYKQYTKVSNTPQTISDELLSFTKSWEGFSATPYQDAGGNWTIGFGNCSYNVEPNYTVTQVQASATLRETLNNLASQIFELYSKYNLSQGEFDSLVDFAYNLGLGALKGSDLVANFEACDNNQVIIGDFTAWSYCDGKQLPGLVRRRVSESDMWLKGEYNNN